MFLHDLIDTHQVSIGLCFLLGALHALEPGHGKTALAAHVLSEKGFKRPALIAFSTAFSHSISILIIAGAVHGLLDLTLQQTESSIFRWLNMVSGLVLLVVGAFLLRAARRTHAPSPSCGCKAHKSHQAPKTELGSKPKKNSINTILLGFAIGLIPCPTALAAMSQAIVSHDWITAGSVILSFSAGIFLGLFTVGSILSSQAAPRLMKLADANRLRLNPRLLQVVVVCATGTWHILMGLIK